MSNVSKTPTRVIRQYGTKMRDIAKEYRLDFGASQDASLGEFLTEKGYKSLAEMLKAG
jgi:hypothetical protein